VKINDKHIEVIVRQMLRRVIIENSGDTTYIQGEQVERSGAQHQRTDAEGRQAACHVLQRAAGYYQGFAVDRLVHLCGFLQETTRVLTEAAIMGKRDELRGLKENVIVGRLIPPVPAWPITRLARPRTKWTMPSVVPSPKPKKPSWPVCWLMTSKHLLATPLPTKHGSGPRPATAAVRC
jgi:hypothetical protein